MGTWDETQGGGIHRTVSSTSLGWHSIIMDGFGDSGNKEVVRFGEFDGYLYAGTWKWDGTGTEVWRSATGDGPTWSQVHLDGFGDVNNQAVLCFETFNGRFYAGTFNDVTGGQVWRSSNGTAWSKVNSDGFGAADKEGVPALQAYDGWLYASTWGTGPTGSEVWRCQVCDNSDWVKVVDDGFSNSDTNGMNGLEVYDQNLFFVVGNEITGMEVWRTRDGTNWEQVPPAGFGSSDNQAPYWDNSLFVFDDALYVGTLNLEEGGEGWRSLCYSCDVYLPIVFRND
jgi:hypothetical protein